MPPLHRDSESPRSYGRQAKGKTIKSISLGADLALWAEAQAESDGLSLSAWIDRTLANARDHDATQSIQEDSKREPPPPQKPVNYRDSLPKKKRSK